jgi:hypothetical protein
VIGAPPAYEKRLRQALRLYPRWLVKAARLSRIILDSSPEVQQMVASYRHEDRSLHVYPGLGNTMLTKAMGHEMWHGADDNFGSPHFFSSNDVWGQIHRDQAYFDIPKYRDEPLEYFADIGVKFTLLGREKLNITAAREANFFENVVMPQLIEAFGKD